MPGPQACRTVAKGVLSEEAAGKSRAVLLARDEAEEEKRLKSYKITNDY